MYDYTLLSAALAEDLSLNSSVHVITSDMDVATVRASSLGSAFLKKNTDLIMDNVDKACLDLFLKVNSGCATFAFAPQELFQDQVINEVKLIFNNLFFRGPDHRFSSFDFEEGCGVGPGASIGAASDDFYSKLFCSPLTYTDGCLPGMFRRFCSSDPKWASAEKRTSTAFGYRRVVGSNLSFVPKTSSISRSICTEPTLNMFFQKGIGFLLERVLREDFQVDLSWQPLVNRSLARNGSIDGSFGTIDLKSASDGISLKMLNEILPPYLYRRLIQCRSPLTVLPDGTEIKLDMVSSMGNGFTFPLMTLLFCVILKACYRVIGVPFNGIGRSPPTFGVFGDDLIVRKDTYQFVIKMLSVFGFVVNGDKSFNTGLFRESCGGDYFSGHDVRGVYLKTLRDSADVYSCLNRLLRWSQSSGILLKRTLGVLASWVKFLPIPLHAGDSEGVKCPLLMSEVLRDHNGSCKYYALTIKTASFSAPSGHFCTIKPSVDPLYPWGKSVFFNPSGLLVALVGGFIANGRISLRSNTERRRFKVRLMKTPSWGSTPAGYSHSRERDLAIAFELNEVSPLSFRR